MFFKYTSGPAESAYNTGKATAGMTQLRNQLLLLILSMVVSLGQFASSKWKSQGSPLSGDDRSDST